VKDNYAPAQSLLAALLLQQPGVTEEDYASAFQLASKSAQQGDIAGELELASLYSEGKGTPKDLQKAQLWTQRAQQSKMAAQWKLWNTSVFMGLTPLDVVHGVLVMQDAMEKELLENPIGGTCFPPGPGCH
jgi:TPR repeat protein